MDAASYLFWLAFLFGPGLIITTVLYFWKWRPNRRITSFRGRLLDEVNYARKKRGLGRLGRTRFLDKVAAGHSRHMAKCSHCCHHGFERRAEHVKRKTGLSYVAENCYMFPARKYTAHVAKELAKGWLDSPGHKANLLNPNMRRIGIGIIVRKGYVYATQIFSD
jgi:uncharacterized protein YkwD